MRITLRAGLVAGVLLGCAGVLQAQPPDRVTGAMNADTPGEPVLAPITLQELSTLMGPPTHLSAHWVGLTPQAAFEDLARQAAQQGVELRHRGADAPAAVPITATVQSQPFWVALQALAPRLHLFPMVYGRGTGLDLAPEGNGDPKLLQGQACQRGPVLVLANQVEHSRVGTQVPGQKQTVTQRLAVTFTALIDPKLRVLANRARFTLTQVTDDKGQPLTLEDLSGFDNAPPLSSGRPLLWRVTLSQPVNVGTRMPHFKATLGLPIIAHQDIWDVPDILTTKQVTKTIGTDRYSVEAVTKTDYGYEVRLTASRVRPDLAFNYSLFNAVRLVDAQGREYLRRTNEARRDGNQITVRIPFSRPNGAVTNVLTPTPAAVGEPARLLWEIPRDIRLLDISLDFADLPIP